MNAVGLAARRNAVKTFEALLMEFSLSDSDLFSDELEAVAEAMEIETNVMMEESEPSDHQAPVAARDASSSSFRLNAKNLYLTYPQCEEHPTFILEQCREYWGDELVWVVAGREFHQDGNTHLHVAISLKNKVNFRQADCLDFLAGKHGNYQGMRNKRKCLEYCTKDGDYEEDGIDVESYLEAQKTHKSAQSVEVAQGLMKGEDMMSLNVRFPGFFLMNLPKIQSYQSWFGMTHSLDSGNLTDLRVISPLGLREQERRIMEWISGNLMTRPERAFGKKQLYLSGPTGLGKTSLLMEIAGHYRVFWTPMGEDFYDGYADDLFDVIVLDEFKAQKKIQFINGFVQGSPHSLRIKGGQVVKKKNLPVIITSNYTLAECYYNTFVENPGVIAAIERRFEIIQLDNDIYSLLDRYKGV